MLIAGSFGISYHGDNQNEYNRQNIALIFSLFYGLYSSPRGDGNKLSGNRFYGTTDYTHPREGTETDDGGSVEPLPLKIILIPARGRKHAPQHGTGETN